MLASYPLLRESYALSFTQVGLMTFAFQITGSVFQPFIGSYTDKHPWPLILPLAPSFTLLGFILLALAPELSAAAPRRHPDWHWLRHVPS